MHRAGFVLILLGLALLIVVGAYFFGRYGPNVPEVSPPEAVRVFLSKPTFTPFQSVTDTPVKPVIMLPTLVVSPTPTSVPDPHLYDNIDFSSNGLPIEIMISLPDTDLIIRPIQPNSYYYEVIDDIFWNGEDDIVAWIDLEDRLGIWVHSGQDEPFTIFREWIEFDEQGWIRSYFDVDTLLAEKVEGSTVYFKQRGERSASMIIAALRLSPAEVPDFVDHVVDLIPYLQEYYPTDSLLAVSEYDEILTILFCGRQLNAEERDPDRPYYAQARIILILAPIESTDMESYFEDS